MSGQTSVKQCGFSVPGSGFNGGPDNCPARHDLEEGKGKYRVRASMEGRTIVRPDPQNPQRHRQRDDGFNGGPDNCPARRRRVAQKFCVGGTGFNGGPDNCPARQEGQIMAAQSKAELQWRAGQLSGQTQAVGTERYVPPGRFNGGPDNCPARLVEQRRVRFSARHASMEGRTIVRPDLSLCPLPPFRTLRLQWRAGQLSGQTGARRGLCMTGCSCFNGGPDNCPARRGKHRASGVRAQSASMEGRTIVRPDALRVGQDGRKMFGLQWRAGQLSGQT